MYLLAGTLACQRFERNSKFYFAKLETGQQDHRRPLDGHAGITLDFLPADGWNSVVTKGRAMIRHAPYLGANAFFSSRCTAMERMF